MAKRGRPLSTIKRHETTISLQSKYLMTFERLYHDPFFQKRKHGRRNEIIEEALDEYWSKRNIKIEE